MARAQEICKYCVDAPVTSTGKSTDKQFIRADAVNNDHRTSDNCIGSADHWAPPKQEG